jgi:hypothetical protein
VTACTGPASVSTPSRSSPTSATPSTAATTSQKNSATADAGAWCPITVTVQSVHAQTPTQYPVGGVINVSVGQRLIVAAADHCAPSLQASAKPSGLLRTIAGLPGAFVATSTGQVTLTVIHAMCDGSPWPGCLGGIAVFSQSVLVHPPVA